jgi:hypothetical protein
MVHYIELQHGTVEVLEATSERDTAPESAPSMTVVVCPRPGSERVIATLSHHDAAVLASRLADDLALATWEDAEWR